MKYQVRKSGGGWEDVSLEKYVEAERECDIKPEGIDGSDPKYWTTVVTAEDKYFMRTRGGSAVEGQILED